MLMDIFGIAIAFALIMTVLSVIVTSLSQATQAVFRMRGRNLKVGLAAALAKGKAKPDAKDLSDAHDVMNRCDDAGLRRQGKTDSLWSRFVGPAISWLDETALRDALADKAREMAESSSEDLSEDGVKKTVDGIVERFGRLQKSLLNRYETRMRGVSLVWALLVAIIFQVSSPQLIQELSTDPKLRAAVIAESTAVLKDPNFANDNGDQGDGDDSTKTAEDEYKQARARVDAEVAQLARINITPWRYGDEFYIDSKTAASNIVGVLLTAILLTLGAPFWYDVLKTAVKWRDVYAPPDTSNGNSNQGNNAGDSDKKISAADSEGEEGGGKNEEGNNGK